MSFHNLRDPPLVGCMNKVGSLSSERVLLSHSLNRYYEPLRIPLWPVTFSACTLYATVGSSVLPPQWASRTALFFFRYMPSLLPRKIHRSLPLSFSVTSAFPIRPQGRHLQLSDEATRRFTFVTACNFAHRKLTTPGYPDAASRY